MSSGKNKEQTPTSAKQILIPIELIDGLLQYIEENEVQLDSEYGLFRSLERLIKDRCMPEVYTKLIIIKNKKKHATTKRISI